MNKLLSIPLRLVSLVATMTVGSMAFAVAPSPAISISTNLGASTHGYTLEVTDAPAPAGTAWVVDGQIYVLEDKPYTFKLTGTEHDGWYIGMKPTHDDGVALNHDGRNGSRSGAGPNSTFIYIDKTFNTNGTHLIGQVRYHEGPDFSPASMTPVPIEVHIIKVDITKTGSADEGDFLLGSASVANGVDFRSWLDAYKAMLESIKPDVVGTIGTVSPPVLIVPTNQAVALAETFKALWQNGGSVADLWDSIKNDGSTYEQEDAKATPPSGEWKYTVTVTPNTVAVSGTVTNELFSWRSTDSYPNPIFDQNGLVGTLDTSGELVFNDLVVTWTADGDYGTDKVRFTPDICHEQELTAVVLPAEGSVGAYEGVWMTQVREGWIGALNSLSDDVATLNAVDGNVSSINSVIGIIPGPGAAITAVISELHGNIVGWFKSEMTAYLNAEAAVAMQGFIECEKLVQAVPAGAQDPSDNTFTEANNVLVQKALAQLAINAAP